MKILIIAPSWRPGFIAPYAEDMDNLAKYFIKNYDAEVYMICVSTAVWEKNYEYNGIKAIPIPTYSQYYSQSLENYLTCKNGTLKKLYYRIIQRLARSVEEKHPGTNDMCVSYIKKHITMIKELKADLIISPSFPFYSLKLALDIQKKCKIPHWFPYLLDPYVDNYYAPKDKINKRISEEKKVYKRATHIFATHEVFGKLKFSPLKLFSNKVTIIPTHLMQDNTNLCKKQGCERTIQLVYAGFLYDVIRSPKALLSIIEKTTLPVVLHMYSGGCEKMLEKYKLVLGDRLCVHPLVRNPEQMKRIIGESDILISIGNTIANQMPSKIIQYMSFGKPIIHLQNILEDPVKSQFSNYPLLRVVNENSIEANTLMFEKSIIELKNCSLTYDEVKHLYEYCTVESVGEKMIQTYNSVAKSNTI